MFSTSSLRIANIAKKLYSFLPPSPPPPAIMPSIEISIVPMVLDFPMGSWHPLPLPAGSEPLSEALTVLRNNVVNYTPKNDWLKFAK